MALSDAQSKSLTWIRVMAMLSIVICHLCQAYHSIGADLFNMGVQVFLVMSGYLYGHKSIMDWGTWAKKRVKRVYCPYLLFLVAVIPLYAIFHNEAMNWKALPVYFVNLQGFRLLPKLGFLRIEGIRHVWFITAIMCAYLTTPVLQNIKKYSKIALPVILFFVAVVYYLTPSYRYVFVLSWVYLYAVGYIFANLNEKWQRFYLLLFLALLVLVIWNIHWEDFRHPWRASYRLIHDFVGVVFVLGGIKVLSSIRGLSVPRGIRFMDKYSFPVFLVHFIIMHGPFSMAFITPYRWLNIIVMLMTTAVATTVFVYIYDTCEHLFTRESDSSF